MPNCKREVSLKHFLRKLKRKSTFFNENEYSGLSPSGSAPTLICGTTKILKMHKCFSSDSFLKFNCFLYSLLPPYLCNFYFYIKHVISETFTNETRHLGSSSIIPKLKVNLIKLNIRY